MLVFLLSDGNYFPTMLYRYLKHAFLRNENSEPVYHVILFKQGKFYLLLIEVIPGGGGEVTRRLKWYPCSSEHLKLGP